MPSQGRSLTALFSPLDGVLQETLPNGLRILLRPDPTVALVSIHGWVRVGSIDESDAQAGISHVLEHMVFKGTTHFPPADISRWVEKLGGMINAETSKEYTHYFIDIPRAGASKAVQIMGELLTQASLEEKEWARECPVILEEIKRRNDEPESLVWEQLNQAIFPQRSLHRPVIGSPETVAKIRREDLVAYYRRFYTTQRCVVVVAGDFDPGEMRQELIQAFRSMPKGAPIHRPTFSTTSYTPRHLTTRKNVRQTYMAMGFPTPTASHPDQEALDLLATLLGEGRSSRLVHRLREEKKLVWSIQAANYSQESPGIFAIFLECDPAKAPAVQKMIVQVLNDLHRQLPKESELRRAKNMIQNAWLQSYETYHQQASTLGQYALENQLDRLQRYLPKVNAITPVQLRTVLERYIDRFPLSSATVTACSA